jgi:hypothetical protein
MNRWLRRALRVVVILAIAVGLWRFVRAMEFAAIGDSFARAKLWPLVLAAALNFGCLWGKAVCWRIMLAPRNQVPVLRLFRYTIATFAASAITPARAGELLRVWTLKRRDGVPVADTAAVAVAEKLLDGVTILVLAAPIPWLLPDLPPWVATAIGGCAAIAIAAFIALYIAVGRVAPAPDTSSTGEPRSPGELEPSGKADPVDATRLTRRARLGLAIRRFLTGLHVLRSPARLFGSLGVLLLVWSADLGEIQAVLYAVDVHLSIAGAILTLFTLNLAIALPSTPAQVGALELGAMAGLDLLHVEHTPALAFAVLYHAIQIIPLVAVGLLIELRLVLGREVAPGPPA